MINVLLISWDIYEAMVAHLISTLPMEGCGLLAGNDGRIEKHYPIYNRLNSPTAFEMAPEQLVSAVLELEGQGLSLLAIYHSHPDGPATPSATDIAHANYPDTVQIIVSFKDRKKAQMKGFWVRNGRTEPLSLKVV